MLKKLLVLILTIFLTPLVAGLYGVVHDQLTYTISPEYYTKFKFIQFGMWDLDGEAHLPNPRTCVAVVGFLATWWVGVFIGFVQGLNGLMHADASTMARCVKRSIIITLVVTLFTGLVGLAYGKFYLASIGVDWWLPDGLIDKENFIAVGSMHNFSYLGGLLGLCAGIIDQVMQKRKNSLRKIL